VHDVNYMTLSPQAFVNLLGIQTLALPTNSLHSVFSRGVPHHVDVKRRSMVGCG
jgi:hypothetical protein